MIELLKSLLMKTQNELHNYLVEELKKYYKNIIDNELFIAAPGDIPIVLVAHLDTVFTEESRKEILTFYDAEQGVLWSPNGLGTDDRAGVAMILWLLNTTKYRPHILFTHDEEIGGFGAKEAAKAHPFDNIFYVIELDRMGMGECVFYNCDNKDFEKYINSFGFETDVGTFTDISFLCPIWGVAGVNLSVGYLWEHSFIETFFKYSWLDTFNKLKNMLEFNNGKRWNYIPKMKNKKEKK